MRTKFERNRQPSHDLASSPFRKIETTNIDTSTRFLCDLIERSTIRTYRRSIGCAKAASDDT